MQNPNTFYNEQLEANQVASKRIFKQLSLYSLLRLSVFVLTGIGIYFTYQNWQVALGIGVVGIAIFLFLLARYTDLKSKRNLHKRLIAINEDELKIAFGKRIKDLRKKYKLSQSELSALTNIDKGSLQRIERGYNPTLKTLQRIANAFEITLSELFNFDIEKKKENKE